jgi:hypothetical protein
LTTSTVSSQYDFPNWDRLTDEVVCPLCDYNLRGLTEPRCPECGYQFQWPDLLDPARRDHSYIFEHFRRSAFRSFWQTAFHGLRPIRFWRKLRPDQRSEPRRLFFYWTVSALVGLVGIASYLGLLASQSYVQNFGTITWSVVSDFSFPVFALLGVEAAVMLAWPWLTFLSLMIFQISMRRAKVKPQHVRRCVLYSYDATLWCGGALVLLHATLGGISIFRGAAIGNLYEVLYLDVMLWLAALLLFIVRLHIAYWNYLRFRHVAATILCSQLIVALFVLAVASIRIWF